MMAIPGTTSALIAAFSFGTVFNAAAAALFLNLKGHGSSVFRDGKRLVLVLFFLSAALWAQIDFITTLIDTTATGSCQIGAIVTTAFDQLARCMIEQHILWVISQGTVATVVQYIATALVAARFVLGAVFVGLTRSEFNSVCVPVSSIFILAIVLIVVDAVIVILLIIRVASAGLFRKMQDGGKDSARGKAVVAMIVGLSIWMATSVAMLLGMRGTEYLLRSTVPATGLAILITIVTVTSTWDVPEQRDRERRIPEAPSPRAITTGRSIMTADSMDYPPSRYEDLKREQINSMTAFVQPREVPLPGQGLPNISNPVTGGQGMGGMPVQGQLFPPMRPDADVRKPAGVQLRQEKPKKSFFDSSKGPAKVTTIGRLAISNPVLAEGGSNPLDKVATTDLATAVQMEKERRALLALQLTNPDAQLPSNTPQRVPSTIRKEVSVSDPRSASRPDSATLSTGMATGAQLSPAGDELRRRSPRSMASDSSDGESIQSSILTRVPSPPAKSPLRALVRQEDNGQSMANPFIQPRGQALLSPQPNLAVAGLNLNPKTSASQQPLMEPGMPREETVMLVNNIVYNDPTLVASVMEGAKPTPLMPAPLGPLGFSTGVDAAAFPQTPGTAASIVHRPRPIPRKQNSDGDQPFYPPLRRSRSVGSILKSTPGSPTTLPPLPPPPQPGKYTRPHPNDTKSMTFDEKVKFLFPASQQAKRRSSVPEMPGDTFMSDSPTLTDGSSRDFRARDSKNSVRTRSIFEEQDRGMQREISMGTYNGLIYGARETMDENTINGGSRMTTNAGNKRASSPVLPVMGDIRSATTMESVYSPLPIQQVGMTVMQARAVEVGKLDQPADLRAISALTTGEEMTIMLDTAVAREVQKGHAKTESGDSTLSGSSTSSTWHRRIGDETPSFSVLSEKRGSRRGPPPTPLIFSTRPTTAKQAALIQAAEPSPLPSPEEALKIIQAQLKKYEELGPGNIESPGRQALLNDLEMEMGQQETRWLGMQNEYSRDSISTFAASPISQSRRVSALAALESELGLSRSASIRSSLTAELENSRRSRLGSISSISSKLLTSEAGSRATLWQKRLADAQMEFMDNANDTTRRRSVNFLSISNAGSPTPPESDESEVEVESRLKLAAVMETRPKATLEAMSSGLWTASPAPEAKTGWMWMRPEKPYHVPVAEPPLPGLSVRPAQRKESSTLSINSSQLWQNPMTRRPNLSGLWKSEGELSPEIRPAVSEKLKARDFYKPNIQRSRTVPSRPVTQRPPRRSKRITALPDILEDPQPLPEKRDTLGIFQFPWGEKSDVASVTRRLPTQSGRPMLMQGTMSTGGSAVRAAQEARSQQLEAFEYSSSFFDDYEDGSDDSSDMGSEDEEAFDDTTLFEIANLLQSSDVPSTNSFFGPSRNAPNDFLEDYMGEEDHDEASRRDDRQTILVGIEEELEALQEMRPAQNRVSLWVDSEETKRGAHGKGLPQPQDWDTYDQTSKTVRSKPRISVQPASISSDNLWTEPTSKPKTSDSPMWTPVGSPKKTQNRASLWVDSEEIKRGAHGKGLPQPKDWNRHDQTSETVRAKPRISAQPASISSDNLWTEPAAKPKTSDSPMWTPVGSPKQAQNRASLWVDSEEIKRGAHGKGLPQPKDWDNRDQTSETVRAKPRISAQPASISSDNLWTEPAAKPKTSDSPMWTPVGSPKQAPSVSASTTPKAVPSNLPLWQVTKQRTQGDHGVGLPHPENWEGYDNVEATLRAKPRSSVMAVIESVNLWQAPAVELPSDPRQTWMPKTMAAPVARSVSPPTPSQSTVTEAALPQQLSKLLWSAPSRPQKGNSGLFDVDDGRTEFRTTEEAPAALEMDRKHRSPDLKPLDLLTSTHLWTVDPRGQVERNWLVSPRNVSGELLWSVPSSPKEGSDSGLFDPNSERTEFRTTSKTPVALESSRKPRTQEAKPLEELTSTTLWTTEAQGGQTERNWIVSAPPSPKAAAAVASLQRVTASPEQWDEALNQAVAASYPARARKAPIQATAADWAAALADAVSRSNGEYFDVATRHPVFAASSLTSYASVTHPAATGYTQDVAAVHPVFFGSGAGKSVHPAMPSSNEETSGVWPLPSQIPVPINGGSGIQRNASGRGRGGRISAMMTMFEDSSRDNSPIRGAGASSSELSRSRSASRGSVMDRSRSGSRGPAMETVNRSRSLSRGPIGRLDRKKQQQEEEVVPPLPTSPKLPVAETQVVPEPEPVVSEPAVAEPMVAEAVEEPAPVEAEPVPTVEEASEAKMVVIETVEAEPVVAEEAFEAEPVVAEVVEESAPVETEVEQEAVPFEFGLEPAAVEPVEAESQEQAAPFEFGLEPAAVEVVEAEVEQQAAASFEFGRDQAAVEPVETESQEQAASYEYETVVPEPAGFQYQQYQYQQYQYQEDEYQQLLQLQAAEEYQRQQLAAQEYQYQQQLAQQYQYQLQQQADQEYQYQLQQQAAQEYQYQEQAARYEVEQVEAEPVSDTIVSMEAPQTPITQGQPSLADQLAEELVTPTDATPVRASFPVTARTDVPSLSIVTQQEQQQQQPMSADELAAELITPVEAPVITQLKRSDTQRSVVSPLSETDDRAPMRDSLVSVASESRRKRESARDSTVFLG